MADGSALPQVSPDKLIAEIAEDFFRGCSGSPTRAVTRFQLEQIIRNYESRRRASVPQGSDPRPFPNWESLEARTLPDDFWTALHDWRSGLDAVDRAKSPQEAEQSFKFVEWAITRIEREVAALRAGPPGEPSKIDTLRALAQVWGEGAGDAFLAGSESHHQRWKGASLGLLMAVDVLLGRDVPMEKPRLFGGPSGGAATP